MAASSGLPEMLLPNDLVRRHVREPMADTAFITLRTGADPATVAADLTAALKPTGVTAQPTEALLTATAGEAGRANDIVFRLLIGLALVYSGIAIANTMMMASGQRTRDIGALRMTGATTRQILTMLVWEVVMTIVVGVVLGAVAAGASILSVWSVLNRTYGPVPLNLPWPELLGIVGICATIALLASVLPARLLASRPVVFGSTE